MNTYPISKVIKQDDKISLFIIINDLNATAKPLSEDLDKITEWAV